MPNWWKCPTCQTYLIDCRCWSVPGWRPTRGQLLEAMALRRRELEPSAARLGAGLIGWSGLRPDRDPYGSPFPTLDLSAMELYRVSGLGPADAARALDGLTMAGFVGSASDVSWGGWVEMAAEAGVLLSVTLLVPDSLMLAPRSPVQ